MCSVPDVDVPESLKRFSCLPNNPAAAALTNSFIDRILKPYSYISKRK